MKTCVICEAELRGKQEKFCSNKCRQAEFRSRVIPAVDENFITLSPTNAQKVARLAKDIFYFPDDISPEDKQKILDPDDRVFLTRWAKALFAFHNGEEIWRVVFGYDRGTEFEKRYNSNKGFKTWVRKNARSYSTKAEIARRTRELKLRSLSPE